MVSVRRRELLASVQRRFESAQAGDDHALTGPEALAEADELLTLVGDGDDLDLRVLWSAGIVHGSRAAFQVGDATTSASLARLLLRPWFLRDPSTVPPNYAAEFTAELSPAAAGEAGVLHDHGWALALVAAALDEPGLHRMGIELLEAAVSRGAHGDPHRPGHLTSLGSALRLRYLTRGGGEGGDLDRAVTVLRTACRTTPSDDPDRVWKFVELAAALLLAAEEGTADGAVLPEAAEAARTALAADAPTTRDEVLDTALAVLSLLGSDALARETVVAARRSVDGSGPEDAEHPARLARLTVALGHTGALSPDDIICRLCQVLPELHRGVPVRRLALIAVRDRLLLDRTGTVGDDTLARAGAVLDRAVEDTDPADPDRLHCLNVRWIVRQEELRRGGAGQARAAEAAEALAAALAPGHHRDLVLLSAAAGDADGTELTITTLRANVAAPAPNPALLPLWLADLATLLLNTWLRPPGPVDEELLDEAIAVHRRLLDLAPPDRATRLTNLAELLSDRWRRDDDATDLQDAVDGVHAAIRAAGDDRDAGDRARGLFSVLVGDLAGTTTDAETLDLAEECTRVLLEGATAEHAGVLWHNLAGLLFLRHQRAGTGLIGMIDAARRATEHVEIRPGQRGERFATLAVALAYDGQFAAADHAVTAALDDQAPTTMAQQLLAQARRLIHREGGASAALDDAIDRARRALEAAPARVERRALLRTLAAALRARYELTRDLGSLDEAIDAGRQVLDHTPATHPQRLGEHATLVAALLLRHDRTGDEADVREAIDLARATLAATPEGHAAIALRCASLAYALSSEYRRTGDASVLEEAIALDRRAVALSPPGHPDRGRLLSNLSAALFQHVDLTGNRDSATEAVEAGRAAIAATPEGHPSRALRQTNLAVALAARSGFGLRRRLAEARTLAERAARQEEATPSTRLRACRVWGHLAGAAGRWRSAADAFALGVDLLPRLAGRSLRRDDAEHALTGIDGVHVDAAAAALHARDPLGALTALEHGRGLLLSYALDSRTELGDLHEAAPALAAEVTRLLAELDTIDGPPLGEPVIGAESDRRHALTEGWDSVITQVRALPGFAEFARRPGSAELLTAGADGSVVVVNVSDLRCDALVVTPLGVRPVRLRRLTAEAVADTVTRFLDALDHLQHGDLVEQLDAQATVRDVLAWLWDAVAEPVLDALGHRSPPPAGTVWPRVWWSPTGLLNLLPLHAAGHHDQPGRAVLDRVVSSYAPTLRTLLRARADTAAPMAGRLAVALSRTPDLPPLPATVAEARSLAGDVTVLADDQATLDAVLAALPRAGHALFACHAVSDPLRPSQSRLVLGDHPLAVRDIGRLRLAGAELAFLSACSTARGGTPLADEAIHIASAFQLAGYRHVVGTLWPVHDTAAARISAAFHSGLDAGAAPAQALHTVVRAERAAQPLTPSAWAAHIHAGP